MSVNSFKITFIQISEVTFYDLSDTFWIQRKFGSMSFQFAFARRTKNKLTSLFIIFVGITGTCVHDNLCHWNVHENSCRWVYPAPRKLPQKSVEHHGLHCCCFRVSNQTSRENIYTDTSIRIILNLVSN